MFFWVAPGANQAMADAFRNRLDGKFIEFYSGPVPPGVTAALAGGNIKLGQCQFGTPATNPPDSTGKFTFNTITPDVSTDAVGIATFARFGDGAGGGVEAQVDVGIANTVVILNTTSFTIGGTVTINSAALQHSNGQ